MPPDMRAGPVVIPIIFVLWCVWGGGWVFQCIVLLKARETAITGAVPRCGYVRRAGDFIYGEVNLFAPMCIVQEYRGRGSIVPTPFLSFYGSETALHSFGNTLRIELAPFK
ncbi:hypothetical protein K438DRAFT_1756924 [Mycena galopus ATCC 62051]|nr:hypothetical protein K438DRAFT_1756924 [Mycena galopus ATCC 62051]